MNELISTFHIDWKLIIAQLVNFAIVLLVLKKFAYGPMMKLMTERGNKIEKGIKDAEHAGIKLAEIVEKEKAVLIDARKQAQEIVSDAEAVAVKNKEEIITEAKVQAEKILADGTKKIELQKQQMFVEIKDEISDLVVAATGKLMGEKMDPQKDADLIAKSIQ